MKRREVSGRKSRKDNETIPDNMANWYSPTVSSNVADFKAALAAIQAGACPGSASCSNDCPRPILRALNATLDMVQLVSPGSQILIVSQSGAEDYALFGEVMGRVRDAGAVVCKL